MKKYLRIILCCAILPIALLFSGCLGGLLGGGDTIDYTAEDIQGRLDALSESGYKITLAITTESNDSEPTTTTVVLGAKGDLSYFKEADGAVTIYNFGHEGSSAVAVYSKDADAAKWDLVTTTYTSAYTKETAKNNMYTGMESIFEYLYQFTTSNIGLTYTKGGTQTIAGIECREYSYSVGCMGASIGTKIFISEETDTEGLCLKWEITGSAEGEMGGVTFSCTELLKGNDVTITLPPAGDINDDMPPI